MGFGSGAGLPTSGTVALTVCSFAGFTVWACALKLDEDCEPTSHAAAAKERQETAAMMRTDERRKRSSAKSYLFSIVTVGNESR
jgi:hypothetical protein